MSSFFEYINTGATRRVFLLSRWAIKIPSFESWKLFLRGLLCNLQEADFSKAGWPELCPVVAKLPLGLLLVMKRARPLTEEDWLSVCYEDIVEKDWYMIPAEDKMDSFGWLDGHIVAVDYGG